MICEIELRPNGSKRVKMHTEGPSRTRQEFKNECDLGLIVRRFMKTPEGLQALRNAQGYLNARFEDVSNIPDYRDALELIKRSEAVFEALPAILRSRFQNDVASFLDFVDDPKNLDELRSLGLANPVHQGDTKSNEAVKPA